MSQPSRPGQPNPHVEGSGTLIETDEEIRQAISGLKGQGQPESPPTATIPVATPTPNKGPSATLYRPTIRPPGPGSKRGNKSPIDSPFLERLFPPCCGSLKWRTPFHGGNRHGLPGYFVRLGHAM